MAGVERSEARRILRDILDESAEKRTEFAEAMGCDDGLLGKKLNGTNGRDVGLGELEALERGVQVQWLKRYGKLLGCEVRDISAVQQAEELIEQFEALMRSLKVAKVGRPQMVRAELERESARKAG